MAKNQMRRYISGLIAVLGIVATFSACDYGIPSGYCNTLHIGTVEQYTLGLSDKVVFKDGASFKILTIKVLMPDGTTTRDRNYQFGNTLFKLAARSDLSALLAPADINIDMCTGHWEPDGTTRAGQISRIVKGYELKQNGRLILMIMVDSCLCCKELAKQEIEKEYGQIEEEIQVDDYNTVFLITPKDGG
jgi:hypothetical protein